MPRLFLGVRPPARVKKNVHRKMHEVLQKNGAKLHVSRPENWHITVHFIGNVTPRAAKKIREAFSRAQLPAFSKPLNVALGGEKPVKTFGKDVVFINVNDTHGVLAQLHAWGRNLVPVTLTHANYTPHLTLARNPRGITLHELLRELNRQPFQDDFPVREIVLFDSKQERGKTTHTPVVSRRLSQHKQTLVK